MKRFFCTVCNKVRRVRCLPSVSTSASGMLEGICRWHERGDGISRASLMSRSRIVTGLGSTRRISASSAKSKSKK